jgi:uncharacterized Zn finger protein (UPF0148 family)
MKIRGQRECKSCGAEWSYYDTGEIACPECGSLHSVGTEDDRTLHTATAATLDLTPIRGAIESEPLARLAERAGDRASEFTRGYGFIDAGRLQPLEETYVAAMELRHVAAEIRRRMDVSADEERYFTELLRADEGERPPPESVPPSMRAMRGLAYANACREYRSDIRTYREEHPDEAADTASERLSNHVRRIRALDGDVEPRTAETLLAAARSLGEYLIDGKERDLAAAEQRLDALE